MMGMKKFDSDLAKLGGMVMEMGAATDTMLAMANAAMTDLEAVYKRILKVEEQLDRMQLQIDHEAVRPELRMSDLSEEHEIVLQNRPQPNESGEERNYAREAIELLMAQLKPDERLIITLLHIEQRSTQEISQLTGLSISLVKVKAFRTRHKMKRLGKKLLRGDMASFS